MKSSENAYFKARKSAAIHDERLNSREMAAEMLNIHPATLADYENGSTKVVPVDKVMLMSDLYNCPELKTGYCKHECPIGRMYPLATECRSIEGIALRLITELDPEGARVISMRLAQIAEDGIVSRSEQPELDEIIKRLDRLVQVISEIKIYAQKLRGGSRHEDRGGSGSLRQEVSPGSIWDQYGRGTG